MAEHCPAVIESLTGDIDFIDTYILLGMSVNIHIARDNNGTVCGVFVNVGGELFILCVFRLDIIRRAVCIGMDVIKVNEDSVEVNRAFHKAFGCKTVICSVEYAVKNFPRYTLNIVDRVL